ncbi:MAG: metallophosphoesterase [Pseudomonadota bacterium]
MVFQALKPDKGLLKRLKDSFSGLAQCEELDLKHAYRMDIKKIRLPLKNYPIQLNIGSDATHALHIYPERQINDKQQDTLVDRYIIYNPKSYFKEISGFFRLDSGDKLIIGRNQDGQNNILKLAEDIAGRHLSITNNKGSLVFKCLDTERGACISPLIKTKDLNRINKWRFAKLKRLRAIYGGSITSLPPENALDLIRKINGIMQDEVNRPKDKEGNPGGILAIPPNTIPFLVGDLHTKADNLLVILSHNGFLEALKKGRACLVILGDAVHSEEDGQLEKMQSSMLIMDLIFKLKLRFPKQVFYLRGNHDSFSEEIGKRGVPQGLIWERALIKFRGESYRDEMQRFYHLLPYIAYSDHFIACHAAPPTSRVCFSDLVNIRNNPSLANQLINNRLRKPNKPSGYFKREIKNFRKCMRVSPDTPVIVGHTPLSNDDTLWEKAGDIENHTIIYGSDDKWVGVITQIDKQMYPLRYPTEPLIPLINAIET